MSVLKHKEGGLTCRSPAPNSAPGTEHTLGAGRREGRRRRGLPVGSVSLSFGTYAVTADAETRSQRALAPGGRGRRL